MAKVRNIVFDCNESILDLTTVTPIFSVCFAHRLPCASGSGSSSPTPRR